MNRSTLKHGFIIWGQKQHGRELKRGGEGRI